MLTSNCVDGGGHVGVLSRLRDSIDDGRGSGILWGWDWEERDYGWEVAVTGGRSEGGMPVSVESRGEVRRSQSIPASSRREGAEVPKMLISRRSLQVIDNNDHDRAFL